MDPDKGIVGGDRKHGFMMEINKYPCGSSND